MPLWTDSGRINALMSGVPVTVFDAESLSDGEESIAVAIPNDGSGRGVDIMFDIFFGATPTTVDYQLQVANNNVDAEFASVGASMTDVNGGFVVVTNVVGRFARIIANDADAQTVTGTIKMP